MVEFIFVFDLAALTVSNLQNMMAVSVEIACFFFWDASGVRLEWTS